MPTTSSTIIETQYLPPILTFAYGAQTGSLCWEAHEHYQKGGYRNRCQLVGPNGPFRLSVPLRKGKHEQQPIREVAIAYDEDWPRQHWHSIRTAYGNAPFFPFYAEPLQAILLDRQTFLWELNRQLIRQIIALLKLPIDLQFTEDFQPSYQPPVVDVRQQLQPNRPPMGVEFPPYPQVFTDRHGFTPNLGILDLLFCTGPAAGDYLHQIKLDS